MKKSLFKAASVAVCATLAVSLSACSSNPASSVSSQSVSSETNSSEKLKVGIIQFIEHQSLDDIYKGIIDGLSEEGFVDGQNIEIDYLNGQGDQSNLKTISQRFVNNNSDLIIAIATPAAQAAASETTDIPILAASVTDMEGSSLVESNEAPGGNITGVSDLTPVIQQIDLLLKLKPDAQNIGLAYCSNEVNSEIQINMAKEYLDSLGKEYTVATAVTTNDIAQTLSVLTEKVDALYIPVDNTFASSMPTVMDACSQNKLPVVVGALAMVEEGALASCGFDYYDCGVQSGKMAAKLLNGADPATTPVEFISETYTGINKTYADEIGITIPEEVLKNAKEVY